jgi:hypothetical protein
MGLDRGRNMSAFFEDKLVRRSQLLIHFVVSSIRWVALDIAFPEPLSFERSLENR